MAENIGNLYPTKLPDYDDPADIKEALRLYHYGAPSSGTGAYNPENADPSLIPPQSVAGYLKAINTSIVNLQNEGYGSTASATEPSNVNNGYIWLDLDTSASTTVIMPSAIYQSNEPTTNLTEGMLWVDKDSSPLTMYVYDSIEGWRAIGE